MKKKSAHTWLAGRGGSARGWAAVHDGLGAHDRVEAVGRRAVCGHKDRRHLASAHLLPKWHHVLRAAMPDLSSGFWHQGRLLASIMHC